MGTSAGLEQVQDDRVIEKPRFLARFESMTIRAGTGSRGAENEFPVRIPEGSDCDLGEHTPMLRMTFTARSTVLDNRSVELRHVRHRHDLKHPVGMAGETFPPDRSLKRLMARGTSLNVGMVPAEMVRRPDVFGMPKRPPRQPHADQDADPYHDRKHRPGQGIKPHCYHPPKYSAPPICQTRSTAKINVTGAWMYCQTRNVSSCEARR